MQRYYQPAPIATGYILRDEFWVVQPVSTINLVTNPSMELGLDGYAALNSTISQEIDEQRRGAYSAQVTPSSALQAGGIYFDVDVSLGVSYTFAVDLLGTKNAEYKLLVSDPSASIIGILPGMWGLRTIPNYSTSYLVASEILASKTIRACGGWERPFLTWTADTSGTRRFYLVKSSLNTVGAFYTDGWQIEALPYPTTYCDGDLRGFLRDEQAYLWTGAPHASTSTRSAYTRSGGRLVSLRDKGFVLLAIIGLGLPVFANRGIPLASGGELFDTTVQEPRAFTITGQLDKPTPYSFAQAKAELADLFNPLFNVSRPQPHLLHYMPRDACDKPLLCSPVEIVANYAGGLEGNTASHHNEPINVNFTGYNSGPVTIAEQGNSAMELDFQRNVTNANYILERDGNGVWKSLGVGANGTVGRMVSRNGLLYVIGSFTSIGGVAANRVAVWNGSAWAALGSGLDAAARELALDSMGNLYVVGDFTTAGGGGANRVAKWDGSTWSALGTGLNGIARSVAVDASNNVYVSGAFTTAGGGGANRIAKWDGSTWSALGTGLNDSGYNVTIAPDGTTVYVGGLFTTAGGTSANRIAKWNGSTWSALGSGLNGETWDMLFGPDGYLYVAGFFNSAGGNPANSVARWNGTGWQPLGSGLQNAGGLALVTNIYLDKQSNVYYFAGLFTDSGSVPLVNGLARWNGSVWITSDVEFPTPASADAIGIAPTSTGGLYVSFDTAGTAIASGITSFAIVGDVPVSPHRVEFTGPGRVVQLLNVSTGKALYFNLTLLAGETAVLNLTPSQVSFQSNVRGNLLGTILPGSNLNDWKLIAHGQENLISTFILDDDTTTKIVMHWRTVLGNAQSLLARR